MVAQAQSAYGRGVLRLLAVQSPQRSATCEWCSLLWRVMFNQPVHSARELLVRYHVGGRDFKGAYLESVQLEGACLVGVNLNGANLVHANLQDANCQDADLRGADLRYANLQGTDFEGS